MKHLFTIAAIAATFAAQASGTFTQIEINPLHGNQSEIWLDSSKTFYGAGEMSQFAELNGKLYFNAASGPNNEELWVTDGTPEGTSLVKDISPIGSSHMGNFMRMGNRLYFMATEEEWGTYDLWSTDGTTAGTTKLADLDQGWNDALAPKSAAVLGNKLIFCTWDKLLTVTAGSNAVDTVTSVTGYTPGVGYCELGGNIYFMLSTGAQRELWKTNGTMSGTQMLTDFYTSAQIQYVSELVAFNGKMYMSASIIGGGSDLFSVEANGQATRIEIVPGGNAYPTKLTVINGALYFTASNMTTANIYKLSPGSNVPVEMVPGAAFSYLSNITFAGNNIYFTADGLNETIHRINLNNNAHTTIELANHRMPDYWDGIGTGGMLVSVGSKIYFAAYEQNSQKQVFMESDGTTAGTHVIMPENVTVDHPFNILLSCGAADVFDFRVWGDKVIVPANFNESGRELWIFKTNESPNAIDEVQHANTLQFFPNPTSFELTVKTTNHNNCAQQLVLTNVAGQVVKSTLLVAGTNTVNVATLAAGNYCATLTEDGKAVATKKLVVVK